MNDQTQVIKKQTVAAPKASALNVMASRLSVDPDKLLTTLKSTVFQKATNEELLALTVVANTYDLNPFLKEIYAFPAKGGGIVPIVSVDGWNKMLLRQPDFDGIEFDFTNDEEGNLYSCTATIYVKSRSRPVKITEFFSECKRNTDPWNNMPRRMLRNRTLCQASRVAFGFAGVYDPDEAQSVIDVSAPPPKLVKVTNGEGETTTEAPKELAAPKESSNNNVVILTDFLASIPVSYEDFCKFVESEGIVPNATSLPSLEDWPAKDVKRMITAKAGLIKGLKGDTKLI